MAPEEDAKTKPTTGDSIMTSEANFAHEHTAGRYSQSGITTIVVGPEEKLFYVHTNLLRQKSEAFRAALSGKWKKGSDGESEIVLEDEDPDVVETIIDWIYHGTLPKLTTTKLDFSLCLLCYKFAETRMMYSLKNTIVDLLRKDYVQHGYIAEATEVSKAYKLDLGNTQIGKFPAEVNAL